MAVTSCAKHKLMIILFLTNTIYGLASPFLPTVLQEKGISSTWTGVIFASYAISMAIASPIVGKQLEKTGHSKMLFAGIILMTTACLCFSLVDVFKSEALTIVVSIILRLIQGKKLKAP